jgi:dihydroorotate dehydrogenase (fumarate)
MQTATSYLGLRLPHPFIAGASPLGTRLDSIKRLEDAGCAAVVLHSLFEEQITYSTEGYVAHADAFNHDFAEVVSQFPPPDDYPQDPDAYAEHIYKAKQSVAIPIIASLNGTSDESWLMYSQKLQQAGADALEVNMYQVVTDLTTPGAVVEARLVGTIRDLKRLLTIPVAVKLSPYFAAFGSLARQLDTAGADALVLFNRFYQRDIDIRTMTIKPQLELSTSAELLLRLRWLAILYGRIRPALAVSGGVATPHDAIKAVLAGADVIQMVSALLRHGPEYVKTMRRELERWLDWNQASLDEMRGRVSHERTTDPLAFERAHYIRVLHSWPGKESKPRT